MLRLCYLTWSCSRKPKHSTLSLHMRQIQNFSSIEHADVNVTSTDFSQLKPRKRVNKNSPILKDVLQSPDSWHHMKNLADLMECDETVVRELISRESCLLTSKLVEKCKLLKDHGFSVDDIVANPSVLHRSLSFLQNRLQTVKSMPFSDAITLHAITETDTKFESFVERCRNDFKAMKGFVSREQFFAHLFQCDEKAIAILLKTNKFMMSISPTLITSKMNTLTAKFKIPHRFVRENSKILFHASVVELDRRLTLLNDKQLLSPNLCEHLSYLLSCNRQEFLNSFSYTCERKEALEGCADQLEYVCFRLKCSESAAKYFLSSSRIKRMSQIKLKQMLYFLLHEIKMEPAFVIAHRDLFIYSIKRIRERWEVLCNIGYRDVTLLPSAIVLTDKQFSAKFGSYIFVDTFNSH